MRRVVASLLCLFVTINLFAATCDKQLLDKITFRISKSLWVESKSALLSININSSLKGDDFIKARDSIMDNLQKIAPGKWRLSQFQRSQDNSGLEKLYALAEARIEQKDLANVFKNAKSISIPGTQYSVMNIKFEPSLDELQSAQASLRDELYKQVNDDLATINNTYKEQHYSVYKLTFIDGNSPEASSKIAMSAMVRTAPQIATSSELRISALVQAASNRKDGG